MQIYIDTAEIPEIREAFSWGIVSGVTTNPTLMQKAREKIQKSGGAFDIEKHIKEILAIAGKGCLVSLEVLGTDAESMINEAKFLYNAFNPIADNVVIKIPVNPAMEEDSQNIYDGLKAISALKKSGIRVNATLIMTPEQAYLAAQAGAAYVSPFIGRMDVYLKEEAHSDKRGLENGKQLIDEVAAMVHGTKAKIIAASIRNYQQVRDAKKAGADIATIPFKILKEMICHPMTSKGMKAFMDDAGKVPEYIALLRK